LGAPVYVLDEVPITRYRVAATTIRGAWGICVALCGITSVVPTCLIEARAAPVQIERIVSNDCGRAYCVGGRNSLGLYAVEVLSIRQVLLLGYCRNVWG